MTEPAELTHDVLIRVAEFLRKVPADQLADLARGDARLEVVPKGARVGAPARTAKAGPALPLPAEEIERTLSGLGDRAAATRYLDAELRLNVDQLKALAKALHVTVPSRAKKADIQDHLVEWAVGRRQDSDAISRAVSR